LFPDAWQALSSSVQTKHQDISDEQVILLRLYDATLIKMEKELDAVYNSFATQEALLFIVRELNSLYEYHFYYQQVTQ
jgi:hypothetical protein